MPCAARFDPDRAAERLTSGVRSDREADPAGNRYLMATSRSQKGISLPMLRFNDIADRMLEYNPAAICRSSSAPTSSRPRSTRDRSGSRASPIWSTRSRSRESSWTCGWTRTVAAGLLHDTIEDTLTTPEELRRLFGEQVAFLVEGLTKIAKIEFTSARERQAESFRKMLVAMSKDIRILLIKLADRLHNMRTLDFMSEDSARRVAQETLDIYVAPRPPARHPLDEAGARGLSFRALRPEVAAELERRLRSKRKARERYIEEVIGILSARLGDAGSRRGGDGPAQGPGFDPRKDGAPGPHLDEIYDVIAFRTILDGADADVYAALGIVHSIWRPVPGGSRTTSRCRNPTGTSRCTRR